MKILNGLCLALVASMFSAAPVWAQAGCHNDEVSATSGSIISLNSGWVLKAYPGANATISFWQPLDKVVVCPLGGAAYSITNTTRKDEMVKALRSS